MLLFACQNNDKSLFTIKSNTGINFKNTLTHTPQLNILNYLYYYNGGGVSSADFNNDGLIDLYFTGNQTDDKLYLNQGNLQFKDITVDSGIQNKEPWTTGVTNIDINNDGLLDIYICKIGNYRHIEGQNLLYINQGIQNGIPTFKEDATSYGLDFRGFSTQASFFDFDADGDLDMFLLNHSTHPNRTYGKGDKRKEIDKYSGDKLFENINGKYVDVTEKSKIYQGKIGYGLGASISDINNDGFQDIYVGNDFFENDYLYINQGDKTFKEVISNDNTSIGHTTHFSMGNAIDDINNDGNMDIISLDMLPENLKTYKTSGLEYAYPTYEYYLKNGYSPQYMQNTLHLNLGSSIFSEIGFQSGIAASEWSWCPLIADFDNDGFKDMYITNGIFGATNDMDFINFVSNEKIQKKINQGMSKEDLSIIDELPQKKTANYFFKNNGNNTFKNKTSEDTPNSFSNGATYADLDNDGDLDIVVNNVNEIAHVIENKSINIESSYLKIKLKGSDKNKFGLGAKVKIYSDSLTISQENYSTRGYLSSVQPELHFGLGKVNLIDSIHIIWSDKKYQTIRNIKSNQELTINYYDAFDDYYSIFSTLTKGLLTNTSNLLNFKHKDGSSVEFNRDPLIPYASTNLGPEISIVDVNNDSLEDIFISGGKRQASQLNIQQTNGEFQSSQNNIFEHDAINEDVSQVFFDANNDGFKDLLVVSGGNEFRNGKPLRPRLYINKNGVFTKDSIQFQNIAVNASKVKAVDIDNDGDLDINICSNLQPWKFGVTPTQYIFENDGKGSFKNITSIFAEEFETIGNIQDIVWIDMNGDKLQDAIAVGHWMPISIFINNGKQLELQKNNNLNESNGWWNSVIVEDFDKDGDLDIISGNWGLNSRLNASSKEPITLYSQDFDDNGRVESLVTYYYQGEETPFASKDELVKQMPFLNKKYLSYADFANADFTDLFSKEKLSTSLKKEVYELASCYFKNNGNNTFEKHELPFMAQVSNVFDIVIDDFNNDQFPDLLLIGNNYEISTQLGRFDASHGVLLLNDKKGFFTEKKNQNFNIQGPARSIEKIKINGTDQYIIGINNNTPIFLTKELN
ncbi:VCBS repeat-containing protein [Urechidicola croceus]|uniref:ASPIC/UnbV domain-containing protein n=1 Tax=Urechidicola croceus TaxID=1850246 RepID=A0A1D8PAF6_9FLAO|nr:VCBS repeat-containing protein [Urechidicola croceus]AOW21547.1 hypothetical protein LPB138_13050 [Urechidicola croceus]